MKVNIDKYVLAVVVISVVVAFLTHFPELISLFDHSGENNLFPGMRMADVANEVFFTFIRSSSGSTVRRRASRGERWCCLSS